MLRESFVNKYNDDVVEAFRELFEVCCMNMFHSGDLLLCQQNGTLFSGKAMIGLGAEGINSLQQINAIFCNGIGKLTGDDDYFKKSGNKFFLGTSELEMTIQSEMKTYQEIWENLYFLRILTETVRVANGERYDWQLDMYKLGNNKSNHIRDQIIKKLDVCPKFKKVIEIGYKRQIRNAVAHSQSHVIQGGLWFENYKKVNKDEVQAIGFEEWERVYSYSYFIFRGLFEHLTSIVQQLYMPAVQKAIIGGIPILCNFHDDNWGETFIYPYQDGKVWRFNKPN